MITVRGRVGLSVAITTTLASTRVPTARWGAAVVPSATPEPPKEDNVVPAGRTVVGASPVVAKLVLTPGTGGAVWALEVSGVRVAGSGNGT